MEVNRNQWFLVGMIVLLLGVQLRVVDNYVLKESTTRMLADKTLKTKLEREVVAAAPVIPRKVLRPPEWSGWCLLSIGSVLILHSLAMRRPD